MKLLRVVLDCFSPEIVDLLSPLNVIRTVLKSLHEWDPKFELLCLVEVVFELQALLYLLVDAQFIKENGNKVLPIIDSVNQVTDLIQVFKTDFKLHSLLLEIFVELFLVHAMIGADRSSRTGRSFASISLCGSRTLHSSSGLIRLESCLNPFL